MPVNRSTGEEQDDRAPSDAGRAGARTARVEFDERRAKMERLRAEGIDPYPPGHALGHAHAHRRRARRSRPGRRSSAGEHPELRYQIAGRLISRRGHGKTAFLDMRDLSGHDPGGRARGRARAGDLRPHPRARHRRHRRRRRLRVRDPARPARARGRGVHAADQDAAPAAGQAPRARRHRHALPLPRARPARQRGDARAVHHAQQDRARDPRMAGRTQLRGGRNPRAAVARRRRRLAPVHHAPQRARPRPVPAHLGRAVPQPLHRRRHGERLRHGQGVPQRGHLAEAQPRVHDHRVHVRVLRLQRRGDGRPKKCSATSPRRRSGAR